MGRPPRNSTQPSGEVVSKPRLLDICFANSPAIRWFGHLIPADGIVPARDVCIYWTEFKPLRIRNVAVVYLPLDVLGRGHPVWSRQRAFAEPLRMSSGNCLVVPHRVV
jgi:hypothetical protein